MGLYQGIKQAAKTNARQEKCFQLCLSGSEDEKYEGKKNKNEQFTIFIQLKI